MIQFQYPELFLVAIPLWFAYRRWGRAAGMTGVLRIVLLAVLLLALTGPRINVGGRGVDVILVADRSRSMPAEAAGDVPELIQDVERNRGPGDRTAVVTFAADAQIEHVLSNRVGHEEYTKQLLPDGSDLSAGIEAALNLVDPNRPARILVFSDGEANGASPLTAARRAREEGVPIDFRLFERLRVGDAAVESVQLPESVTPREPFQFAVWIYSDAETGGKVQVRRDGRLIASREETFATGMNRLLFRDLLEAGGFYNYAVELEVDEDPLLENNTGAGVVRVDAGPRLLVLNQDGAADTNLVRRLEAGRIPLDVAAARSHPLTQDSLDAYRAVIMENVPARDFGRLKMERLAQFVEDLGGGLMLTGGERSFGVGGYFQSPLDAVLPVSMEIREEHRKNSIAIAIALDRSGSMTAPVKGGKTKMDLANLGTAACVRLLSPGDSVAVIAVDSSPHLIQALTPVDDPEAIARKALGIESLGGGIFVYEALVAAGKQLVQAEQSTKHIILFSDAADSEQPGDYKKLLAEFERSGITVSVIGLGTKADTDAKLLEDVAKRGQGNLMFTADAEELPRLFTEDTMSVARSSFVKKEAETQPNGIPGAFVPDARLMGNLGSGRFPNVDGYNLSYLKPDATLAVVSQDEYQAPWAAFWYRGLGRVAAVTLEVDGEYTGEFADWEYSNDFLITHARWLLGGESPDDVFVELEREGQDAHVTLELDPARSRDGGDEPPELIVVPPGDEREEAIEPDFIWTGPDTLEARFPMDRTGTFRTLVKTGPRQFTRGPAVTLPYSPEFVPRQGLPEGSEVLEAIAELTGGVARTDVLGVLDDPPRSARTISLLPWLFIAAIALLLLEIAGRRLSLWERLAEPAPATTAAPSRGWLPQWKLRLPRRGPRPAVAEKSAKSQQAKPKPAVPAKPAIDVYEQAKRRAKRRLE